MSTAATSVMVGAGTPAESVSSLLEEGDEEGGNATLRDAPGRGHFTCGTQGQQGNNNTAQEEKEEDTSGSHGGRTWTNSEHRRRRSRRRRSGSRRSGTGGGTPIPVEADGGISPHPDGSTASVLCPTSLRDSGCWTPAGTEEDIGVVYCESLQDGIESLGSTGNRRDSAQLLRDRSVNRRKSDGVQLATFSKRRDQLPAFPNVIVPSDFVPTSAAGQRAMPKAQYERYKKEIMRKLARTLQNPNGGNTKEKSSGAGEVNKKSEDQLNHPLTNGVMSSSSPNLAIPASWRLPVGWAGRNKSFLAASKDRSQRNRGNTGGMEEPHQKSGTTIKGRSPLSILNRSSANAFRDRSHFTRSWVQNSFSAVHPLEDQENQEGQGAGTGPHPYRMRIGHLLHGAPNHYEPDADSSLDPPSRIQTDGVMRHPNSHMETSRTGFTSQSVPKDMWPSSGQQKKRKTSRGHNGRAPLSRNMNTFSRMSVEAQAALKEMGVAPLAVDGSSEGSGHEKDKAMEEIQGDQPPPAPGTLKVTSAVPSSGGTRVGSRSNMPNLRNTSGEKQNKSVVFYQHQHGNVYHTSQNADFAHMLSDRKKGPDKIKPLKESNTRHASISGNVEGRNRALETSTENRPQVTITAGLGNGNKEENKKCSCDIKTGHIRTSTGNDHSQNLTYVCPNCESHIAEGKLKKPPSQGSKSRMRLPNIRESPTGSVAFGNKTEQSESTIPFFGTHRQIPGIGQYKMPPGNVKSSSANLTKENTFEITPVGYDSRFEDIIKKDEDEMDDTPEEIKQKAIDKCTDWLKKYH